MVPPKALGHNPSKEWFPAIPRPARPEAWLRPRPVPIAVGAYALLAGGVSERAERQGSRLICGVAWLSLSGGLVLLSPRGDSPCRGWGDNELTSPVTRPVV
jgi:hypothetical protein